MALESATHDPETNGPALRRTLWPIALFALVLALLFVATRVSAWSRDGAHDVDHFRSHAEHVVDRVLDRLDATDEQASAIHGIVAQAIDELHSAREESRSAREAFRSILTASAIDREAIEALRAAQVERADRISRILAERIAEVMEVLTAEQRAELEAHLAEHHGGHRRHGRGWH